MKLLLDTHIILWLAEGRALNEKIQSVLADPANDRLVSHVSLWEIAIKRSTGKLIVTADDIDQALDAMATTELPIARSHVLGVENIPFHHSDPFDRLLIAQAIEENAVMVTADRIFSAYGIPLLRV